MSEQAETPEAEEPQKRKTPISRIILFSILGVAIIVLLFDLYSRRQANAAFKQIEKYTAEYEMTLEDEDEREKVRDDRSVITMAKVQELVGKPPTQEADPEAPPIEEIYVWPGFWKHSLTVRYSPANEELGEPYIVGAELDHQFWFVQ